jgi:hypothetical protein
MRKVYGALVAALMLSALVVGSAFAVDYSSAVTAAGSTLVSDAAPSVLAGLVIALALVAIFTGAGIAIAAFKLSRKGK